MNRSEVYLLYNTNASDIQLQYHESSSQAIIKSDLEYEEKDEFTILYSPEDNRNYTNIKLVSRTKLKSRPQSADSFINALKPNVEGVILRRTSSFSSIEELFLLKKCPLIRPLLSETEILSLQKLQEECRNVRRKSNKKGTESRKSGNLEIKSNVYATEFAVSNIQSKVDSKLYNTHFKQTRIVSPFDEKGKEGFPNRPATRKSEHPKDKLTKKSPKTIEAESNKIPLKQSNKPPKKGSNKLREASPEIKNKGNLDTNNIGRSNKLKLKKEKDFILEKGSSSRDLDTNEKLSKKAVKTKSDKSIKLDEEGKFKERESKTDTETDSKSAKKRRDESVGTIRETGKNKKNKNNHESQKPSELQKSQPKSPSKSLGKEKTGLLSDGRTSADSSQKSSLSKKKHFEKNGKVLQGEVQIKKEKSKKADSASGRTDKNTSKLGFKSLEEPLKPADATSEISTKKELKPFAEQSGTVSKPQSNKDKDKKPKKIANLFQYMIQYILSDPKFFQLGWTITPTDKSNSRLVTFRALPANPVTCIFRTPNHTETKSYCSGKSAMTIDLDGNCTIYYPEGLPAVVVTNHEKCKRLVIYSNPKKDPLIKDSFKATVLGIFDSFGNADVYDSKGNKILCYNQLEGFYKNATKNTTYKWKWKSYETLKQRQIKEILNSMVEDVKKSASLKSKKETKSIHTSGSVGSKKPTMEKKTTIDKIYESVLAELPEPAPPKSPLKNDTLPTNFKTVILKINSEITLRINGQDKTFLTYSSEKFFYKIDIGVVIDPDFVVSIDDLKGARTNSLPCIFDSVLHISPSLQKLNLPK